MFFMILKLDRMSKYPEERVEHVPILCVIQQTCTKGCLEVQDDISGFCADCGVREQIFKRDPVIEFVNYVVRPTNFDQIICIAHNAKGFYAYFVLKHLVEKYTRTKNLNVILNSNKIISISFYKTIFIDSLNFFHMPLSALPRAFGFESTKGYFPYLFEADFKYIGPIPNKECYAYDTMSCTEREMFIKWHDELVKERYVFNFQNEIIKYCKLDVEILRKACIRFRKIIMDIGNICPLERSPTIASAYSRIFRRKLLKDGAIGLIPTRGYRMSNSQSRKALEWLALIELERGVQIIHAGNNREYRLKEGLFVDGYYEVDQEKHVLEFYG